MKQIMHIVGNRPQFIKLAPLSKELRRRGHKDIIIHTGQHYDANMSDIFFKQLQIEQPAENLDVGSGSHAYITGQAMIRIEKACTQYHPSLVVLYGDTDSTLAAAIACRKLNIPIVHVEAGVRSYAKDNPEETNRVLVDHISDACFCPDRQSVENLKKEGICQNAYFTGDIMYDAFLQTRQKNKSGILERYGLQKDEYVLMTWHRQENTDSKERMEQILAFLEQVPCKTIYPIHPRTKKMLQAHKLWERLSTIGSIQIIDPVGYEEMVSLQSSCRLILTDSGGLSKESVFAGVRCLFMADLNIWPDLEQAGWLQHIHFNDQSSIRAALKLIKAPKGPRLEADYYGDGHAAEKIADIIEKKLQEI